MGTKATEKAETETVAAAQDEVAKGVDENRAKLDALKSENEALAQKLAEAEGQKAQLKQLLEAQGQQIAAHKIVLASMFGR